MNTIHPSLLGPLWKGPPMFFGFLFLSFVFKKVACENKFARGRWEGVDRTFFSRIEYIPHRPLICWNILQLFNTPVSCPVIDRTFMEILNLKRRMAIFGCKQLRGGNLAPKVRDGMNSLAFGL